MRHNKPICSVWVVAILALGTVGPIGAHEEQTVEGNDVTFCGADKPLVAGEQMWLEFGIVDNETSRSRINRRR